MQKDTNIKETIESLLDFAYDRTIERIHAIEEAPKGSIYRTIGMIKGNYRSYVMGYLNYYLGCLEGIFFTMFLDEFNRMPTPSENAFVKEAIATKFENLKKIVSKIGDQKFVEDNPK